MSELLVNTIKKADGTGSLTVPAESGTVVTTASPSLGRRRLTINGDMRIAQRGTSSTATSYQTVDRIQPVYSGGSLTQSQDTNAPDGFSNSFKWSCTTAADPLTSGQYAAWYYKIEGQDLQHLKYGTASAQSVTLSFWVKSNLTGTFQVNLENSDNNRRYGETYTINSAGTWEYKTVTYSGDTVGALDNDNASSLRLEFWVAAGSTWTGGSASQAWETSSDPNRAGSLTASLLSSTSNYIQYTGLQLEVGSVSTPYEHRSFGDELALCQRYYFKHTVSQANDSFCVGMMEAPRTSCFGDVKFAVPMRSDPTALETTGTASDYEIRVAGASIVCNVIPTFIRASIHSSLVKFAIGSTELTDTGQMRAATTNGYLAWSAEL